MMSYADVSQYNLQLDVRQPEQIYLRAVLCAPPYRYSVEPFLATGKSSGKYRHGMYISSNGHSSICHSSLTSRAPLSEYNIWRSWEDCLWFQQTLEEEYARAAREKKTRLTQGKGVKGFNGLYKKDLASSWESLPPGPNPTSVAQDIHKHLPTLTKRGSLFRTSPATIDQRQAELIAFVKALFSDDMPALIKEIRVSDIVTDFFGQWRRDYDHAEESQKARTVPRDSVTSSVFSSYFSASHPSLPSSDTSSRNSPSKTSYKRFQRSTTPRPLSTASSNEISEVPRYPCQSPRKSRSRPNSTSSESSVLSESSSDTSLSSSSGPAIADDVRIVVGHNPLIPSDPTTSILEVLPEEQEIFSKPEVGPKPRTSTIKRNANRSYSVLGLSLKKSLLSAEKLGDRPVRESWQTTDSQDSAVNDLLDGLELMLPHPIKEQKFRASIASISTFMTTDSVDAVIPRTPSSATVSPTSTRTSVPLSLSDFDIYTDTDDNLVLDAPPRPSSIIPVRPESRPETSADDLSLPDSPSSTRTAFNPPASPTLSSSVFSTTTSASFPVDSISIKAIHNTSIILLRVSRRMDFAEVRQRLYNKFVGQEGIPLSQNYNVAFVPPNPVPPTDTRSRSTSVTSANQTDLQPITLESDWEGLMSTLQGNKITLRILDVPTA